MSAPLRAGAMVRVVNPMSPYLGATGHVIGRSEQVEDRWMIRLTTLGQTLLVVAAEVEAIPVTTRPRAEDRDTPEPR
jgi:hypothetical protein